MLPYKINPIHKKQQVFSGNTEKLSIKCGGETSTQPFSKK